jgi:drug/metabolite transporter (DMT)-like permease
MLLCGFFFSLMSMLIRIGAAELPATTMILARNVLAFVCLAPLLFRGGLKVARAPRPLFSRSRWCRSRTRRRSASSRR